MGIKKAILIVILGNLFLLISAQEVRPIKDQIGFATNETAFQKLLSLIKLKTPAADDQPLFIISPHDDYLYAGRQYFRALSKLSAHTFIILGVYHSVHEKKITNKLIFDTFSGWKSTSTKIKISDWREKIISALDKNYFIIDDQIHLNEHSIEAVAIFLHQLYPRAEIVPIIVAPSELNFLEEAGNKLAEILLQLDPQLHFTIISSADAIHYGDQGWGKNNFLFFGSGKKGYRQALANEKKLVRLLVQCSKESAEKFFSATTNPDLTYRLSWCGRFTITLGLLTSLKLSALIQKELACSFWKYETSLWPGKLADKLENLSLTAPATIRHWVGYLAARFKICRK